MNPQTIFAVARAKPCSHALENSRAAAVCEVVMDFAKRFFKLTKLMPNGCIEWQGCKNAKGYGMFWLKGKTLKSHRAAWMLKNGEIPADMCVCHRCDNPACVNVDHFFLGTKADNNADTHAKGRGRGGSCFGERNGKAKLTVNQVMDIRCATGTKTEIAKRFGISRSNVFRIKAGQLWKNLWA